MTAFEHCKEQNRRGYCYAILKAEETTADEIIELLHRGINLERDKNGIHDWYNNSPYIRATWRNIDVYWD